MYTLDWYLSIRKPAPKKEIVEWACKKVMKNFFLYRLAGKKKEGKCTACDKSFIQEKKQRNRYVTCPFCGEKIKAVEYEEKWKTYEHVLVGYLEKYAGFFLHRIFRVARSVFFSGSETRIEEAQMQVLGFPLISYTSGFVTGFSKETTYMNDNEFTRFAVISSRSHIENWKRGKMGGYSYNIFQVVHRTFPYNLQEVFKGTIWEHSYLWDLAASNIHFNLWKALIRYANVPQLEYVIKLKLHKIAVSIIRQEVMYEDDNNVIKFLGLNSRKELQYVIDNDMTGAQLNTYRRLLKKKLPINDASFKLCNGMRGIYDSEEKILKLMTAQSFYDYYLTQKAIRGKLAYTTFLRDYFDHIRIVKELKLDIQDTMYSKPKDFYVLHIRLSEELSAIKNKKQYDRVAKALRTEKSYAYAVGPISLIVPKTAQEIVHEGKVQNHCVGTYLDRVADKSSIIVFIRRIEEPDKAFYTMEINPKTMKIVQCRGLKNCEPTPEVKEFIQLYERNVLAKKLQEKQAKKAA
jgi:DNA-directed RNA polymerase subunit RPC12/RpoP